MRRGVLIMADGSRFSLMVTFPKSHGNMTSIVHILTSFPNCRASFTVDGDTDVISIRDLTGGEAISCVTRLSSALIPGLELCSTGQKITLSVDLSGRKGGIGSKNSTPRSGRV